MKKELFNIVDIRDLDMSKYNKKFYEADIVWDGYEVIKNKTHLPYDAIKEMMLGDSEPEKPVPSENNLKYLLIRR